MEVAMGRSGLALEKTRLVIQEPDGRTMVRSVAEVVILGSKVRSGPITLRGQCTLWIGMKEDGKLRSAFLFLDNLSGLSRADALLIGAGVLALGVGIGRAWGI